MSNTLTSVAAAAVLALMPLANGAAPVAAPGDELAAERKSIEAWRATRAHNLTSESGWLTLVGLFWLKPGENTFGRLATNTLALDNPPLPDRAGSFLLEDHRVRFTAASGSRITHDGAAVDTLELLPDSAANPTELACGSLRFFVIERAGNLGVRVRDLNNPRRLNFRGLEYFPVSTDWVLEARFEPYPPEHRLKIVNILGMEEELESPGALVFSKDGREWRLDAVLEARGDSELFVMFADVTSGHETYGGGRFLYVPLPAGGRVRLDFNRAYNPPCALNDFATCPLPPAQNRLKLRVAAGEKKYAGAPQHGG